ncbi:polysaccharide pyruvyl transferase family protein [Leuconostoc gasicomitatum]|uniref:polysaccharide pyruvyl transferase family protein n=1 Tax=Leuconostoc gasicomitatum TaxID=115778 RepID=UPI001CC6B499|nr:polysaccharide pyruvyl transferase family protein [Leuconostoc gasicomitatum]MBZ5987869.1 polysaccharide pyruvyl transferase family protein [Leuconostoc gasicomitatum]MBZ5989303.1 polysaccharide pyruvyl transferase family protein [Leuconostoc gasicomitatum]
MLEKIKASMINEVKSNKEFIQKKISNIDSPLRCYYWSGVPNFGDRLMPLIINHFFPKLEIQFVSLDNAELIGVGSLLTFFDGWRFRHLLYDGKKNARIFWGSGMLNPEENIKIPNSQIISVRGKLSQELMKLDSEITLGDPGLLLSSVIPKGTTSSEILIIPHFQDYNNKKLEKFKRDNRFEIIDVRNKPEDIIKKISSATLVLSSSLHGLIIADSYNVPNMLYNISGKTNFFKYDDYYSATNRQKIVVDDSFNLLDESILYNFTKCYHPIENLEQIKENIVRSFPFTTMQDVVEWRKVNKRTRK